ncbi:MAG: efflux RND transporter periplasmic adaptor subunit [Burkholderiales bacterium]
MKKPHLSFLVKLFVVLLLLASAGTAIWLWKNNSEMPAEQRYRTRPVERGTLVQSVSANGTLNPVVLVTVGSQISARVTKLYADFNQRVKAGQVLAELDPALLIATEQQTLANLASARALLRLARANEERFQQLFAQEYISRQEMDQAVQAREAAQAQVQVYEAQHSRDRANLHYTVIRSPVSGVVVDRQVDVGQTVAASLQAPVLFKIAQDLKQMQINSAVAEADVGAIRIGQEVDFRVDAFSDREFKGKVKQIRLNPTITSNVVTYNVVVSVDNADEVLLPGMTAYITITTQTKQDVLMVPSAALRFRPAGKAESPRMSSGPAAGATAGARKRAAGSQVHALRGGKIEAVAVQTGITNGRVTEIAGGDLREGDMVVVEDLTATPRLQTAPSGPRTRLF